MKLNELAPKIVKKARRRKGQGNATGNGTYAGRGMNGQNARAGGGVRLGFEGGQSGLLDRMPKLRGFKNPNRIPTRAVNLSDLEEVFNDGDKVDLDALIDKNLVGNGESAKILGKGKLTKKLEISGLQVSESAKKAIEKAGGKIE